MISRFLALLAALVFPPLPPAPTPPGLPLLAPRVVMVSSYYGPGFHGRQTASGERFNQHAMTVAHRTLPFGTRLQLTYPRTGKSVTVRVTDRGPFAVWKGKRYYRGFRDLDVSEGVAVALGFRDVGLATLYVEVLDASHTQP